MKRVLTTLFASTIILSGCATKPSGTAISGSVAKPINASTLYLRGVFNWWEAQPSYRFKATSVSTTWYTDVELVADGQPYDFRVADEFWTAHQNCGSRSQAQPITEAVEVTLTCQAQAGNLQFTPDKTGTYRFVLTHSGGTAPPSIKIKRR